MCKGRIIGIASLMYSCTPSLLNSLPPSLPPSFPLSLPPSCTCTPSCTPSCTFSCTPSCTLSCTPSCPLVQTSILLGSTLRLERYIIYRSRDHFMDQPPAVQVPEKSRAFGANKSHKKIARLRRTNGNTSCTVGVHPEFTIFKEKRHASMYKCQTHTHTQEPRQRNHNIMRTTKLVFSFVVV